MGKWIFGVFITISIVEGFQDTSTDYDRHLLRNKYPDYGKKWIYFPDGEEVPRVGYLEMPDDEFPEHVTRSDNFEDSLKFTLFTRSVRDGVRLQFSNDSVVEPAFDRRKAIKFVTHGWLSNGFTDTCLSIKDAFLGKEDVNVIILDWSEIAGNIFYPIPMANTKRIGILYAKFIDHLIKNGANGSTMHLIGHSLGAHISGFAGRAVLLGKIDRITALDPALPGFVYGYNVDRLLPSDAQYVDVIHTCGGVLGILRTVGHADFYPNGGAPPQPGCSGVAEIVEACSHGRSWKYFAESISSEPKFISQKCESWDHYFSRSCKGELVQMGNPSPPSARGSYFLETGDVAPYARLPKVFTVNNNEINN